MPGDEISIKDYAGKVVIEQLLGMHDRVCQSMNMEAAICLSKFILEEARDLDVSVARDIPIPIAINLPPLRSAQLAEGPSDE